VVFLDTVAAAECPLSGGFIYIYIYIYMEL
jgi:hypothetical protein